MRISDWSSDVCSSDLSEALGGAVTVNYARRRLSTGYLGGGLSTGHTAQYPTINLYGQPGFKLPFRTGSCKSRREHDASGCSGIFHGLPMRDEEAARVDVTSRSTSAPASHPIARKSTRLN